MAQANSQQSTTESRQAQSGSRPDQDQALKYVVIHEVPNLDGLTGNAASLMIDDRNTHNPAEYKPHDNGALKRLSSETGYVFRFIKGHEWEFQLNAFVTMSLPHLASYPVSEATLESLPANIKAHLQTHGWVLMRGLYDSDSKTFTHAMLGWERGDELDPDWWVQHVIDQFDISPTQALDYATVAIKNAEGKYPQTVASWSDARGVGEKAIRKNVRTVVDEVDDKFLTPKGKQIAEN